MPLRFARHPRARRYVLRLCSDGTARVTIPRGGSRLEARRFANRNLRWLEKQLLRQANRPAEPKVWTAGTEILFRDQRVQVELCETERVVRFGGEVACLIHKPRSNHQCCKEPVGTRSTAAQISRQEWDAVERIPTIPWRASLSIAPSVPVDLRPAIEKHLRQLASRELPLRVAELAREHGFQVHRVTVRNQRSRWGSCSKRGTVSLNWRLIQTPLFVRDYIILHELAHLKEMNHSRRFWREVARLCPDFARAERWLKEHGGLFR